MLMKLNVGLSKKIGLPDFGSLGASCHAEFELEQSSLTEDPGAFRRSAREAFAECQRAVEEQLSRRSASRTNSSSGWSRSGASGSYGPGDPTQRADARAATDKQVKMIRAMAGRQRIALVQLLRERFGISQPAELSLRDASALIDELKRTDGPVPLGSFDCSCSSE